MKDGMDAFNREAIQKLIDYIDNDFETLHDRARAMIDIMRGYSTYSGIAEGKTGITQFLIKTEGVDTEA